MTTTTVTSAQEVVTLKMNRDKLQARLTALKTDIVIVEAALRDAAQNLHATEQAQRIVVLQMLGKRIFPMADWDGWKVLDDAGLFCREAARDWVMGDAEMDSNVLVALARAFVVLRDWRLARTGDREMLDRAVFKPQGEPK